MSGVWVRSQDGRRLHMACGVEIIPLLASEACCIWADDSVRLGEYTTEARAREVLDEIQRHITDQYRLTPDKWEWPVVYQMPKE